MSRADRLNSDFRDLLVALNHRDAEFIMVGAYALALHGVPRATGDMDILIRATPLNAERVEQALADFGAPLRALGISRTDFVSPGMVVQIGLPPRRIDILTQISGVSFDEAWNERERTLIDGIEVSYLSREHMIRNKRSTGRIKDLADVERLTEEDRP